MPWFRNVHAVYLEASSEISMHETGLNIFPGRYRWDEEIVQGVLLQIGKSMDDFIW